MLIAAQATRALENFVLVFPDLKVRLRLLRLFTESPTAALRASLKSLARHPGLDPRVAAKLANA